MFLPSLLAQTVAGASALPSGCFSYYPAHGAHGALAPAPLDMPHCAWRHAGGTAARRRGELCFRTVGRNVPPLRARHIPRCREHLTLGAETACLFMALRQPCNCQRLYLSSPGNAREERHPASLYHGTLR